MLPDKRETSTGAEHGLKDRILTIIGTILCVILLPVFLINLTLIIKSYTNDGQVPDVGGYLPLIVLTDSMYPEIQSGDLIICRTAEPETVATGDIIAFFDPAGSGTSVVTHQVVEVMTRDGELQFRTRGIANSADDQLPVPASQLVGVYRTRIAGAGNVAMFLQTNTGLLVCVVLPLLLLVGYDLARSRIYEQKRRRETDALLEELEALKREKADRE